VVGARLGEAALPFRDVADAAEGAGLAAGSSAFSNNSWACRRWSMAGPNWPTRR
jgi:hypothetical protein